jgi:dihydroorotase-like cyclic amidohydrolase
MSFDLIIKNGLVATAADLGKYDIGVKNGKIAILALSIDPKESPGAKVIDAEGAFATVISSPIFQSLTFSLEGWIRTFT